MLRSTRYAHVLNNSVFFYKLNPRRKRNWKDSRWINFGKRILPSKVAGRIFITYLVIVLLGMVLLAIPGVCNGPRTIPHGTGVVTEVNFQWNFLYSLFNASSAFSDTGLMIPNAALDYSFWGQFILAILIELGGFGVITFKVMVWIILGLRLNVKDIALVQGERGSSQVGSTIKLIKESFLFLFTVQAIAAMALFFVFYFSQSDDGDLQFYHSFWKSIWAGIFHSISAINNAGFDIIGSNSLQPYNHNYPMQFIFLIEFVVGGIGFPTFFDLKRTKFGFDKTQRLSLFTKINLITYLLISVIGVGLVALIEYTNTSAILNASSSGFNGFMDIFFNTMSTRNAGFSTVDTSYFLNGSKIVHGVMMFIGSAPASTAGGIRTTTFAIICLTIFGVFTGREKINLSKRRIPDKTVRQSFAVLALSSFLVLFGVFVVSAFNPQIDVIDVFYTIASAFGTVGLSNISFWQMYDLGAFPLIVIILIMFIGQLGVSSTLLSWSKTARNENFDYPEEDVVIG